ncbi:hypothetical protein NHQ30_002238 [Ciborinia camelliae]|nr:hypothetical protein NHQ30_002238 [Ciborinia camelliae]
MGNARAESRSSRATPQDLADRSDISPSEDLSPIISSAKKLHTPKNKKVNMKNAVVPSTDENSDASDGNDLGDEDKLNSCKSTTTRKKPASKAIKPKAMPVTGVTSDDGESEEKSTKKPDAVPKSSTAKKPATTDAEVSDNDSPAVSDSEKKKPLKKAALPPKSNKKRAAPSANDGPRSKKARGPRDYEKMPDSYEELNEKDKLLFDLRKNNPKMSWKELAIEYRHQAASSDHETTIRKRYQNYIQAAGSQMAEEDIYKMCLRLQDLELEYDQSLKALLKKHNEKKWTEVQKYIKDQTSNEHPIALLEKKYTRLRAEGKIDQNNVYMRYKNEDTKEMTGHDKNGDKQNDWKIPGKNYAEGSDEEEEDEACAENKVVDDDDDEEDFDKFESEEDTKVDDDDDDSDA